MSAVGLKDSMLLRGGTQRLDWVQRIIQSGWSCSFRCHKRFCRYLFPYEDDLGINYELV
jgi:hypothetical protein